MFGSFPSTRMRRNRKTSWIRDLVAENILSTDDLIWPVFIIEGKGKREKIKTMPGVERLSIDQLIIEAKHALSLGIKAIALFPVINQKLKSLGAEEAFNQDNLVCRAVKELKKKCPDMGIICDIALDPYTTHGHDGILGKDGDVDNDVTLDALCAQGLALAKAGCDIIAPSDMMDGRIATLREMLDEHDYTNVSILAYSAKYASNFYSPFRDALGSSNNLGKADKKTYQMDYRNSNEAIREVAHDIDEGADMVMIKPGLPYLDIINQIKQNFHIPVFAYHVSGEYAMLKIAAENNALDYDRAIIEVMTCFKRAGCSAILTYSAIDVAKILKGTK